MRCGSTRRFGTRISRFRARSHHGLGWVTAPGRISRLSWAALLASGSCSQFVWLVYGVGALGDLDKGYPVGMRPLGAHGFLYGWYLAVFQAMEEKDKRRVAMLYEAALTATIIVYADCDKPTLLMHAMHFSEIVRHSTDVLVDSFVTFAQKCHAWNDKLELDALRKAGVRFNGCAVSLTMLKAINHVKT